MASDSGFTGLDQVALSGRVVPIGGSPARRIDLMRARVAWRRALGEPMRSVASPADLKDGTLLVLARDGPWKKEMDRLAPEILARLQRVAPRIGLRQIRFRLVKEAAPWGRDAGDGIDLPLWRVASEALARRCAPPAPESGKAREAVQLGEVASRYLLARRGSGEAGAAEPPPERDGG